MNCHLCGAAMQRVITDLPFKVSDTAIVILKGLPVVQCVNCSQYLIEDPVMEQVESVLKKADQAVELEIVKFAA